MLKASNMFLFAALARLGTCSGLALVRDHADFILENQPEAAAAVDVVPVAFVYDGLDSVFEPVEWASDTKQHDGEYWDMDDSSGAQKAWAMDKELGGNELQDDEIDFLALYSFHSSGARDSGGRSSLVTSTAQSPPVP